MKIDNNNYIEWILMDVDNELSRSDKKTLLQYLQNNVEAKLQWEALMQTKVTADENIVYELKIDLYAIAKENNRFVFTTKKMLKIASMLLAILGIGFMFFQRNKINTTNEISKTDSATRQENKVVDTAIVQINTPTIQPNKNKVNTSVNKIALQASTNKIEIVTKNENELPRKNIVKNTPKNKGNVIAMEEISSLKPANKRIENANVNNAKPLAMVAIPLLKIENTNTETEDETDTVQANFITKNRMYVFAKKTIAFAKTNVKMWKEKGINVEINLPNINKNKN